MQNAKAFQYVTCHCLHFQPPDCIMLRTSYVPQLNKQTAVVSQLSSESTCCVQMQLSTGSFKLKYFSIIFRTVSVFLITSAMTCHTYVHVDYWFTNAHNTCQVEQGQYGCTHRMHRKQRYTNSTVHSDGNKPCLSPLSKYCNEH